MDTNKNLATAIVFIMSISILVLIGMFGGYYNNDDSRAADPGINVGGHITGANNVDGNPAILKLFYKFKLYTTYMLIMIGACVVACASMLTVLYSRMKNDPNAPKEDTRRVYISMIFAWISFAIIVLFFFINMISEINDANIIKPLRWGVGLAGACQVISFGCLLGANQL